MKASLSIKGTQDGLLVSIPEGDWGDARPALLQMIDEQTDFFQGARLILQIEQRALRAADLGSLRDALAEREVNLWAVLSSSDVTKIAAADLGLAQQLSKSSSSGDEDVPFETMLYGDEAVLVEKTLRSGHSIRHPGHVIILGDINPGAEVIAGGNVMVWGRLRGMVHAGAAGDESSKVYALDLSPTQLRIAGQIAVSPTRRGRPKPEVAQIREGQLVAEEWQSNRRR
ncbi:MAG TPA: septum site-determining protein MinC [Anaerolineae bacterium]|nr:septum site-determining protein MinC [Anaerolineae bacterium]